MTDDSITVQNNAQAHRYEVFVDGDLAGFSAYRDEPGRRVFTHTKIDADYEGHGVGSALARVALDDTRAQGLSVAPRCPFIAEYIHRHPEYADLAG
jgi:predicted GNAT family acetyltransferase